MLKRMLFVLCVLAQGAMFNTAWGADRDAQVKEFMHVLQFDAQLRDMHGQVLAMLDEQTKKLMAQIRQAHPNLDDEAMQELNAAVQTFTQRVLNSWDPDEAARIYGRALTEGMPDKDLEAAIAHYRTPQGQRELKVISAASASLNAYIMQNIQRAMDGGLGDYMAQVRTVIDRQKARWTAKAAAAKK